MSAFFVGLILGLVAGVYLTWRERSKVISDLVSINSKIAAEKANLASALEAARKIV